MKSKNYGKIFWITGLSGSGKSTIGKHLKSLINKKYGKTVLIHGDDIRNIFQFKLYSKNKRLELVKAYSNLCKLISKQKINVIFTTVGLFRVIFKYNRKNLVNYTEILIKSDLRNLKKKKSKIFYKVKTKNVWGIDIKPEYPSNPHITIENDFRKGTLNLAKEIFKKIEN